ncbi:MAG: NAD(P)H-hydrate epimerase [Thaumarchaeota archaeon]|nr:NAD(P)H-hydrate epimerase [Nitrososphaerota archaeon]
MTLVIQCFPASSLYFQHINAERSEQMGVSKLLLMENAGRGLADFIQKKRGDLKDCRIVVVAGLGNNGGDGFVCARHLAGQGASVTVIILGPPPELKTSEASLNWKILEQMKRTVKLLIVYSYADLQVLRDALASADVVVDAVFGTGIKGRLREPFASAIRMMNEARAYRVAVDVPSGVDPLTGEVHDVAVKAHATVTFHKAKTGILKAKEYVGEIVVAPIGVPPEAEE